MFYFYLLVNVFCFFVVVKCLNKEVSNYRNNLIYITIGYKAFACMTNGNVKYTNLIQGFRKHLRTLKNT